MTQQAKSSHIDMMSSIDSFGDYVYKVGLTRRLDPTERVRGLGDGSACMVGEMSGDFSVFRLVDY